MRYNITFNKQIINGAENIIVTLKSGSQYLYTGTFQYKLHEKGSWSYMDSYNTNSEYIDRMFDKHSIKSIDLLFKDSNKNKTIYLE